MKQLKHYIMLVVDSVGASFGYNAACHRQLPAVVMHAALDVLTVHPQLTMSCRATAVHTGTAMSLASAYASQGHTRRIWGLHQIGRQGVVAGVSVQRDDRQSDASYSIVLVSAPAIDG
jgi:hypothetical protein